MSARNLYVDLDRAVVEVTTRAAEHEAEGRQVEAERLLVEAISDLEQLCHTLDAA